MVANTVEEFYAKRLSHYTAKYIKIESGYMGQLVEWPEVVTEGRTLEECHASLHDALREMVQAYRQLGKEIPQGGGCWSKSLWRSDRICFARRR